MRPLLAALCALALAACTGDGPNEQAAPPADSGIPETAAAVTATPEPTFVVARIADGDTIELEGGRRVRLLQIDAPELTDECYGQEAAAALRELLEPGDPVTLERDLALDDVDEHGRLLRYVQDGPRNLNLLLVRRGAATPYFYRGERGEYADRLIRAAKRARAGKRGLWGACPGTRLDPLHAADTGPVVEGPAAACPDAISWRDARAHVGEHVTVRGRVAGTLHAQDVDGQPTFLNLGSDYPDPERVTVVIWGRTAAAFPARRKACTPAGRSARPGRSKLYEGVPELEVSASTQIEIAG